MWRWVSPKGCVPGWASTCLHIRGSRSGRLQEDDLPDLPEDPELARLAEEMIRIAEEESGQVLSLDHELRRGLMNHLAPVISRLRTNLEIRNPLLEEIKANFPQLMELAAGCCKVAERYTGLKFPEAEVAYVAMHLGAALGKAARRGLPLRACLPPRLKKPMTILMLHRLPVP